jgi:hypothetical protein
MNKAQTEKAIQANLDAGVDLRRELALVERELAVALEDLRRPFSQLVQGRLRESHPLVRAAIVLTAGVGNPDRHGLTEQRIYLAAALEMLRLALGIHTRLLTPEGRQQTDQSILGSTILAGDFCFSRAAGLAVKTGSPVVVDIFAQALQRMSEGHLRHSFDSAAGAFEEDREFFQSGILGANALTGSAPETQTVQLMVGDQLALALRGGALESFAVEQPARAWSAYQTARWNALIKWLQSNPFGA